jgi:arylsulfatase A-like enzyme
VVLVDTLRADHLGCYGNRSGLTPFIDGFADRGIRYARAYAGATWTMPSVASLFTSRWPSQHGVVDLSSVLPATEPTLASVLREHGYATAGFLATRSLPAAGGLGQGFEVWEEVIEPGALQGSGRGVNARAFGWLDARPPADRRPLLLYLHYMEPHFPYDPLPDRLEAALAPYHFTREQRAEWDGRVGLFLEHAMNEGAGRREDMAVVRDYYLAAVATADVALRELMEGLTARGILSHAAVVVTADHGEEFYEHGAVGHGTNLFNETLQVPLLLHAPGLAPAVVADTVSLLDVAPTILELVGIPPGARFAGSLLLRPAPGEAAYAELVSTPGGQPAVQNRTVVHGDAKLATTPADQEQFYDLARDPGQRDPNGLDPPAGAALRETLAGFRARAGRDAGRAQRRVLDEETRERLRALGYVK